jgi:hypothetical protein
MFKQSVFLALISLASTQAYVTKSLFFEDLLVNKYQDITDVEALVSPPELVSTKFKELARTRTFDENEVHEFYAVSFKKAGKKHTCVGTIILESERLSVAKMPVTHQDRGGYVLLDECTDLETEGPLDKYAVFPMNISLPVGDISGIDSYRLNAKYITTRPKFLCTENDMNFEGIPRSQTTVHEMDNRVYFATAVSRSTPNDVVCDEDDHTKCEEIENSDRALYFEDVDQSSVPEVKEFLDFFADKLGGVVRMAFKKDNCIEFNQEDMDLKYCEESGLQNHIWSELFKYKIGEKKYRLVKIMARYESKKQKQISLSVSGDVGVRESTKVEVEYFYVFSDGSPRTKHIRLQTRYLNIPLENQPECKKL